MLDTYGAEGETRTPTGKPRLDPEPSASTSSATSAHTRANKVNRRSKVALNIFFYYACQDYTPINCKQNKKQGKLLKYYLTHENNRPSRKYYAAV